MYFAAWARTACVPRPRRHRQRSRPRPQLPSGPFALDRQKALGERMMRAMGFDFTRGRLDVSHHPFCGGASA